MTTLREAAQQALEFIRAMNQHGWLLADYEPDMERTVAALEAALVQQAEPQDAELSAALGWPGGISEPVLDRKVLLQKVAALMQDKLWEDHRVSHLWGHMLAQQAEPVEPYCYVYEYDGVFGLHRKFYPLPYNGMKPSRTVPVYTAPPQRKPLTDEEIDKIFNHLCNTVGASCKTMARAVERAHKIGEEK